MEKEDSEQILTKTDIEILHLLIKKESIPKIELYKKLKQSSGKYPNRVNDRIYNLKKYNFIEEFDGKKKGSKRIKISEENRNLIKLLIKRFLNSKNLQK